MAVTSLGKNRCLMKKIAKLFAVACAFAATVSCAKEMISEGVKAEENLVPYTVEASLDATKATVNGLEVVWQAGDKIAVFDGTAKREFTIKSGAGTKTAVFEGEIAASATKISAVAPFSAAGDEAGEYIIPEKQQLSSSTTIDPAAVVMVAGEVAKGSTLAFKNPCGIVRMTVPAGTTMTYFGVEGFNVEVGMGSVSSSPKTLDVVVPAYDHNDVFVGYRTSEGTFAKTSDKVLSLKAGSIVNLGDVTGNPATIIRYSSDLDEFLKSAEKKDAFIVKDLDLVGRNLVDTATISGIFDGRGHSIKNWKADGKNLIKTNNGKVKNIVIDNSCNLDIKSGVLDGRFGYLVSNNNGIVKGCINEPDIKITAELAAPFFGALVGGSEGAGSQVIDCINVGDITIEAANAHTESMYLGGVVARVAGDKTSLIKGCENAGDITFTVAVKTAKNIYFGGVTGATNSGANIEDCENLGNIVYKPADSGAAVIIGGVDGYTSGTVTNCRNEGAVRYLSGASIKGTLVGGIVGYSDSPMRGCVNSGDVEVLGTTHEGRNSVGNADGTKTKSTVTALVGGIAGIGVPNSASSTKFSIDNCKNTGNVSYTLSKANACVTSPATAGRHCVGGIVGDCSGPVTNSSNEGNVSAKMIGEDFTASSAGLTIYAGGIAGSNYFSQMQSDLTITNCSNSGDVSVESLNKHTTNHAVGGIVGWPGKESGCTSITSKCTNHGDVSIVGNVICRLGGIQGGSGRIEDCANFGEITHRAASGSAGGVAGFHSGGYQLKNCSNEGNVTAEKAIASGVGGLFGNAGNAAMNIGEGCYVNADVIAPDAAAAVGMIVGHFNGQTAAITIGTEASPVKVNGSLSKGSTSTPVTAENLATVVCGDGYDAAVHTIYASTGNESAFIYAGESYKVVKLKDGKWWMAENLRYVPKGYTPSDDLKNVKAGVYYPVVVNDAKTAATFSKDSAAIKANGYLYQSEVALGLKVGDITSQAQAEALEGCQGICPAGWHIPTIADITGLVGKAVSPITTVTTAPYYNGSNGSIKLLNADGFNVDAYGAVSLLDNTKTVATLMGFLKASSDRITSGYICGSSYAAIDYNVKGEATSGIKNVQFFGMMPMTNKDKEEDFTINGSKLSYRIGASVRCVKNN